MKATILILFHLFLLSGFSQKDKEKILANFDYVNYYPDSTIHSAHQFIGHTLERFTVEFNEAGMPVAMGNFKKGKKIGTWIYSDGSSDFFPELSPLDNPITVAFAPYDPTDLRTGSMRPGCGTGTGQAIKAFETKYQELLNPQVK